MSSTFRVPDPHNPAYARTNAHTISQRVAIIQELLPGIASIAELCCGDCLRQQSAYAEALHIRRYAGLDIQEEIVSFNRERGIECYRGDAMDPAALHKFLDFDLIFFGPPLSLNCDGHHLLSFREVVPGYLDFMQLLLRVLNYSGTLVCISPKTTSFGDIEWLYKHVKNDRQDFGLRLIHDSFSTLTGLGAATELRHKYRELWFSNRLDDGWEFRESKPEG